MLINGRQPFGKNKGGKGIPPSTLREWGKMRNLRPKDPKSGQFIKNTESNRKAMFFMMNRKIKHFGIEPFPFVTMARTEILPSFNKALTKAMAQDIKNRFKR